MSTKNRPANDPSVIERFYRYLTESTKHFYAGTPCHMWTGGKSRGGDRWSELAFYGTFNPGGVVKGGIRAHVYIAWVFGLIKDLRIPEGHNLDHRCHQSLCCNPFHLELVTAEVNQQRRIERARRARAMDEIDRAMEAEGWVLVARAGPGEMMEPPF